MRHRGLAIRPGGGVTVRYHAVSRSVFRAIAAGGGGAEALSVLGAAQYSKNLLLLSGILDAAGGADPDQRRLAHSGYELLAVAQRHDPAAANVVITHPSVGAWARHTLQALRGRPAQPGAEPGMLSAVGTAAAIRAGLTAQTEVLVRDQAVMLPSLGAAAAGGDLAVVRSTASGAEVDSVVRRVEIPADPHVDVPGWRGLRRLTAGSLDAVIDDVDPFRMPAEPDLASRMSAARADTWTAAFRDAWPVLDQHHRAIAVEVAAAVKVVVPRNEPPAGVVSSSSPETFGAVAMSQPPDGRALAETLAHEVQHVKLSALQDVVSLTAPDDGRRFYAPWRDDPRPVAGLLQGAYAFLGVSGFWRGQRHHEVGAAGIRAQASFARWRAATALAIATLRSSGCLTEPGQEFVQGMARTLSPWLAEPVPAQAYALAQQQDQRHRDRWRSVNGLIPT